MISGENIESFTKTIVKEAFFNYFKNSKKETRHILLDRLFPEQRRITSAMAGLQTSLGTSFWEKLAIKFAQSNGFEVIPNNYLTRPTQENEPSNLTRLLTDIKQNRENGTIRTLDQFRLDLNNAFNVPAPDSSNFVAMKKGKGSDLILKKNNKIYIFDIKTVQVNANNGNTFNETVTVWLAYWKYKYRINTNDIDVRLVFPYNSSNENDDSSWWDEYGSRIKPLTQNETLVGNQFWSLLAGNTQALSHIINSFNSLASDDEFINFYSEVFNCTNETELKEFSNRVSINKVQQKHNILLESGQEITFRRKLTWIREEHGNIYECKEKINKLLKDNYDVTLTIRNA